MWGTPWRADQLIGAGGKRDRAPWSDPPAGLDDLYRPVERVDPVDDSAQPERRAGIGAAAAVIGGLRQRDRPLLDGECDVDARGAAVLTAFATTLATTNDAAAAIFAAGGRRRSRPAPAPGCAQRGPPKRGRDVDRSALDAAGPVPADPGGCGPARPVHGSICLVLILARRLEQLARPAAHVGHRCCAPSASRSARQSRAPRRRRRPGRRRDSSRFSHPSSTLAREPVVACGEPGCDGDRRRARPRRRAPPGRAPGRRPAHRGARPRSMPGLPGGGGAHPAGRRRRRSPRRPRTPPRGWGSPSARASASAHRLRPTIAQLHDQVGPPLPAAAVARSTPRVTPTATAISAAV